MGLRSYIPNPDFEEELLADPDVIEGIAAAVEPAAAAARAHAPVEHGDYRDGIEVVIVDGGMSTDKTSAGVYLAGKNFKSHWIEDGTVDTPVFAPLRKGAMEAGLEIREDEE